MMNNDKKRIIKPPRDLGPDNSVRREHLDIWKLNIQAYLNNELDNVVLLQRIVDKIEHQFEHCERFLSDNQDNIKLSYYTEGYYNGRARALEDVIDLRSDTSEKAYNEQYK